MIERKIDHEFAQIVRESFAALLVKERSRHGCSIWTLARRLGVKESQIRAWEAGTQCPPGSIMTEMFRSFGNDSFRRLQDLDLHLQFMKYNRIQKMCWLNRARKKPAAICATEKQLSLVV